MLRLQDVPYEVYTKSIMKLDVVGQRVLQVKTLGRLS